MEDIEDLFKNEDLSQETRVSSRSSKVIQRIVPKKIKNKPPTKTTKTEETKTSGCSSCDCGEGEKDECCGGTSGIGCTDKACSDEREKAEGEVPGS